MKNLNYETEIESEKFCHFQDPEKIFECQSGIFLISEHFFGCFSVFKQFFPLLWNQKKAKKMNQGGWDQKKELELLFDFDVVQKN